MGYECALEERMYSGDEERIVSEGLSLFCKYFRNLWD